MTAFGKFTARTYALTNAILGLLFANVLVFGSSLRMGAAFTAGLSTGIGVGWAIFAIAGFIALRRPGATIDERAIEISRRAGAFAFLVLLLLAAALGILLRSEALDIQMSAERCAMLFMNAGLVAWLGAFLVGYRRM